MRSRLRYHLGPRAAGVGGRAVIRASGTRVPPLPRPQTRNLEDVRGVEQPKSYAKYWSGASCPEELEASRFGCSGPGRTPALSPPAGQPATWAGEQAGRGSWGRAARHVRCIGRNRVHGAQWRAPGGGRAQARRGRRRDRRSLGARRRQLCRALRARVLSGHRCGPNQLFMATWALGQVGARGGGGGKRRGASRRPGGRRDRRRLRGLCGGSVGRRRG